MEGADESTKFALILDRSVQVRHRGPQDLHRNVRDQRQEQLACWGQSIELIEYT